MHGIATLSDQLQVIANILIAAHGGKPGKVRPYPRPDTAIQRARRRQSFARHQDLVARVLPSA